MASFGGGGFKGPLVDRLGAEGGGLIKPVYEWGQGKNLWGGVRGKGLQKNGGIINLFMGGGTGGSKNAKGRDSEVSDGGAAALGEILPA